MKHFKHPATIIAALALFVAFGGGAAAYASGLISGKQITNHSIAEKKLSKKAIKQLHGKRGKRGPRGAIGATGATGAKGATGATGAQGPPGPDTTASNFSQSSTALPITSTLAVIRSIQLTTQGTRRVIASAAVHAVNGVASTGVYLVCHITIDGVAGVNDTDYSSPAGGFTVVDASVSPLASAAVSAGSHTVTLLCQAVGGGTPQATVVDDALAAWAVAG